MFIPLLVFSCKAIDIPTDEIVEQPRRFVDFSLITNDSLIVLCNTSPFKNKSIGVFGGSYSIIPESRVVKDGWKFYLNADVIDYGCGGYGFSYKQGSIQDEVDNCDVHDIYVLWASTNDFTSNREAGASSDYTIKDNYRESNRVTQCGGINYCIKRLKEKNPNCLIVMISSSIFFQSLNGYELSLTNDTGESLAYYVKMQSECCRINKVPFLNLLESVDLEESDFQGDKLHYNEKGYQKLVIPTTVLLACPQRFL